MAEFSSRVLYLYYLKLQDLLKYIKSKLNDKRREPQCKKIPLDPKTIPKFQNELQKPDIFDPVVLKHKGRHVACYAVDISEFEEQILPGDMPKTTVYGYGGFVKDRESGEIVYKRSVPGPTFEMKRGLAARVKWINRLVRPHLFAADPTIHWANPNDMPMNPKKPWPSFPPGFSDAQWPVPTVTHVHGGENPPEYDGHPDAWFTFDDKRGPAFESDFYTYQNTQEPATLWYHDHALGLTRLNVYAGLAGFYLIRDPGRVCEEDDERRKTILPHGKYEIPIVIQDKSFYTDGSLAFTNVGDNPDIHPFWSPEFFGDTIMVNGKVWPNLKVERRKYRFRVLNGSNARFYNLSLSNNMALYQIATDGGFLEKPVKIKSLLLAPAERADLIIDFTSIAPGAKIRLINSANAPYPDGDAPDPETTGLIMQFSVPIHAAPPVREPMPSILNHIPRLKTDSKKRILTLNEVSTDTGPTEVLLNGQMWDAPISELPRVGATEEWVFANLTMDTHPIHLHLVQFQILSRQPFNADAYLEEWLKQNGSPPLMEPTVEVDVTPWLTGPPVPPDENEMGWKDTVRANPGEVTKIRVRFAPLDVPVCESRPGRDFYPFNPTKEPNYVWHCHILDHEDNEMMRPYKLTR